MRVGGGWAGVGGWNGGIFSNPEGWLDITTPVGLIFLL